MIHVKLPTTTAGLDALCPVCDHELNSHMSMFVVSNKESALFPSYNYNYNTYNRFAHYCNQYVNALYPFCKCTYYTDFIEFTSIMWKEDYD